jgi:hypothetical protein
MDLRKYSLAEIDKMREWLKQKNWFQEIYTGETIDLQDARRSRYAAMIEDQLRTYMTNGTDPDEMQLKERK